jgi:predicted enzyme related to lactoylglutathione lyase
MSEPLGKFCWYQLMTTDTAAAAAFYTKVFGWTAEDAGQANASYTLFKVGGQGIGGMMEMPEAPRTAGARTAWWGYIWVPDLDAAVGQITAAGGTLHHAPEDIPGIGRFAVVADPQGAMFILFRHFGDQEGPPLTPATPGHVGWHELHASDREAAFDFYSSLFGWTKAEAFDMGGPVGIYQLFVTGQGDQFGGMMNKIGAAIPPHWLYYITVEDVDAAVARITGGGGQILNGPQEVPGGSWVAQALDPQGGMFAFSGPKH